MRLTVTQGDANGRAVSLLKRHHAGDLYKDMHRGPVAVLFEVPTWVRVAPAVELSMKRMIPIERYCEYKAFTMSLADDRAHDWSTMFDDWLSTGAYDGRNDPRVLPFHIFTLREKEDALPDLDDVLERRRFLREYSPNGELVDASKRRWPDGAPHGRDPQFVRDVDLPLGHHWDVTRRTGFTVETPVSVWRVDGNGHINVYADGCIRRSASCRPIWTESRSKSQDEAEDSNSRQKV